MVARYYLAGGTRVAMRKGGAFYWLLSDHLGSTRKVATSTGALHSQQLYKAWGESRYTSGTLPTRYTYTGQYSYASDFGLVFYGPRFYDPLLARWTSPDSIIPQNQGTQAWDRYSYTSLTLLDIEIAYWSYTFRVASSLENELVKFEILPPWGFGQ